MERLGSNGLQLHNASTRAFLESAFPEGLPRVADRPVIAAIGTIAESAIRSPLLGDSLRAGGVKVGGFQAFPDAVSLAGNPEWTLALVLSPYKRTVAGICDRLTATADQTGVVDTLLRSGEQIIGVNTNAWAAATAIEQLVNGKFPARALIAGTGASSRSVMVGLHHAFPQTEIGIVGRSLANAQAVVDGLGIGTVIEEPQAFPADLVINATTVGQTNDDASLEFDLASALVPGTYYFDLNNRVSALQIAALAKGCVTMSGVFMQIATNNLRTALLQSSAT